MVDKKTDSVVKSEWSFGEANASNTKMPYWWAMAEKRGKDRVILKLINAYEKGLYSEVEADEWNELAKQSTEAVKPKQKKPPIKQKDLVYDESGKVVDDFEL